MGGLQVWCFFENNIPVKPPKQPKDVLNVLYPLISEIYRDLETSIALRVQDHELRAQTRGDDSPERICPWDLGSGVRHELKCRLLSRNGTKLECTVAEDLPNNGLQINWNGYPIRIRKSDDGNLPRPEGAFQEYCGQRDISELFPEFPRSFPEFNLVLLWEFDKQTKSLGRLLLCKPNGKDLDWRLVVPHPATMPGTVPDSPDFNLPEEKAEDAGQADEAGH